MKAAFCLLVLSTLVAVQTASLHRSRSSRADLSVGAVNPGDHLLTRAYLVRPAVFNAVQSEEFVYTGNGTTRISAIQASEYGYTQNANIWVYSGGLNQASVTLRAESQRGRGYSFMIEIWGR